MAEQLNQTLSAPGPSDVFDMPAGPFSVTVWGDMTGLDLDLQRSFDYDSSDPGSATWHTTDNVTGAISINADSIENLTAWRFNLNAIASGSVSMRVGS